MKRLAPLLLLLACGCRRHHTPPSYGEDTPPSGAAPAAPATVTPAVAASGTTPLAAPRRSDPSRMPDGGTINGDPRGPRAAAFNRVVDGAMPQLRACFDGARLPAGRLTVTVHYAVEPPGYTGAITASGNAPQPVLDCCRHVVDALRFPEFRGSRVEEDLPFTWEKRETAGRVEIWDAAPNPENQ